MGLIEDADVWDEGLTFSRPLFAVCKYELLGPAAC